MIFGVRKRLNTRERKYPNYFIEISPSGDYIVENDIPSGGSAVMNWYKNNFGSYELQLAERDHKNVWELIYMNG